MAGPFLPFRLRTTWKTCPSSPMGCHQLGCGMMRSTTQNGQDTSLSLVPALSSLWSSRSALRNRARGAGQCQTSRKPGEIPADATNAGSFCSVMLATHLAFVFLGGARDAVLGSPNLLDLTISHSTRYLCTYRDSPPPENTKCQPAHAIGPDLALTGVNVDFARQGCHQARPLALGDRTDMKSGSEGWWFKFP
jgi:hypothetical protein